MPYRLAFVSTMALALVSGCCKSEEPAGDAVPIGPVVMLMELSNSGACGFTDRAAWTSTSTLYVTTLGTWFKWNQGERAVPFSLHKDGTLYMTGELVRSSCDPYQSTWCDAVMAINRNLPPGSYTLQIAEGRICQNAASGGNGFYRIRGIR